MQPYAYRVHYEAVCELKLTRFYEQKQPARCNLMLIVYTMDQRASVETMYSYHISGKLIPELKTVYVFF